MTSSAEKIRLLIADDEFAFRQGLTRLLADHDDIVVVGEAADGLEAVEVASRELPDVALVAVSLPELNGFEAAKRIKEACPNTAILVLSYHNFESYLQRSINAGTAGFLSRRVGFGDIVRAIRSLYAGEMVVDHALMRSLFRRVGLTGGKSRAPSGELNPREFDVLKLTARGITNKEIAGILAISPRTVQAHLVNIFAKLDVRSRTEAVLRGLREGWIDIDDLT